MNFQANWFNGNTPTPHRTQVTFDSATKTMQLQSGNELKTIPFSDIELLEPVGKQTGTLLFHHKHQIELPDRETHKAVKKIIQKGSFWAWVDDVERSWSLVIVSMVVVLVTILVSIKWGLPAASASVAYKLPDDVVQYVGKSGLKQIEDLYFEDSGVAETLKDPIRNGLNQLLTTNHLDVENYELHFFNSVALGANAFALPSGDIVILDGLFDIGLRDEEIISILAHEIAHVEQRHGMQMLLRYAGLSTIVALAFGDLNSAASLLVAIPKLLLEKGYSRTFESEADAIGVELLSNAGYQPECLASALEKLVAEAASSQFIPTMISSHPNADKRINAIREKSKNKN